MRARWRADAPRARADAARRHRWSTKARGFSSARLAPRTGRSGCAACSRAPASGPTPRRVKARCAAFTLFSAHMRPRGVPLTRLPRPAQAKALESAPRMDVLARVLRGEANCGDLRKARSPQRYDVRTTTCVLTDAFRARRRTCWRCAAPGATAATSGASVARPTARARARRRRARLPRQALRRARPAPSSATRWTRRPRYHRRCRRRRRRASAPRRRRQQAASGTSTRCFLAPTCGALLRCSPSCPLMASRCRRGRGLRPRPRACRRSTRSLRK